MASLMMEHMDADPPLIDEIVAVLTASLMLSTGANDHLDSETRLLGHLPELDSMAVATVLTALEDHFSIIIDDDDVTADMFETVQTLTDFVRVRLDR
ncbi:MAG: phosphopantetheine-binding protein [Sphingomonadaceae bacterium]